MRTKRLTIHTRQKITQRTIKLRHKLLVEIRNQLIGRTCTRETTLADLRNMKSHSITKSPIGFQRKSLNSQRDLRLNNRMCSTTLTIFRQDSTMDSISLILIKKAQPLHNLRSKRRIAAQSSTRNQIFSMTEHSRVKNTKIKEGSILTSEGTHPATNSLLKYNL